MCIRDSPGAPDGREGLFLQAFQVALDVAGHVQVVVDQAAADRVPHRPRPVAQHFRPFLQLLPDLPERADRAVPHGDREPRPDQHRDVAGLDHLGGVGEPVVLDVARGPQHQPRDVADRLHPGPVAAARGLLGDQLVQAEDLRDRGHRGLVRLVQAEPDERVAAASRQAGGLRVRHLTRLPRLGSARAPGVDRTVHHRVRVAAAHDGGGLRRADQAVQQLAERAGEHAPARPPAGPDPGAVVGGLALPAALHELGGDELVVVPPASRPTEHASPATFPPGSLG